MKQMYFQILCFIIVVSMMFGHALAESVSEEKYPTLYAEDLPRYPNARLLSIGRQVSSLRDGIRLKLISADPLKKITPYYQDKMKSLGWTVPQQRLPNDTMYIGRFTKDNLVYQLKVMRLNPNLDETQINIMYLKN